MNGCRRKRDVLWPVDGRTKHTTKVFQVKLAKLMRAMFFKFKLIL